MIKIFHAPMSRSTRVLWLLEELRAPYRIERVAILRPDGSDGPDPANPHPMRQVPVIEDEGEVIVETLVILLHLSDKFPQAGLAPALSDPQRARYMALLGQCCGLLDPMLTTLALKQPLSQRQLDAKSILADGLGLALAEGPFLLGERFSTADLCWFSYLRLAPDFLGVVPGLQDWIGRINGRPALARARALDGA